MADITVNADDLAHVLDRFRGECADPCPAFKRLREALAEPVAGHATADPALPVCRKCGHPIEGAAFGSPVNGWEHSFGTDCVWPEGAG